MRRYFYISIFFIWAASVVWNASHAAKLPPIEFPSLDKILHIVYYIPGGYFCFLFLRSYGINSVPLTFIMTCSIGILDEFIQSFFPSRESSFYDILADFLGILIGIIFARWRSKISGF